MIIGGEHTFSPLLFLKSSTNYFNDLLRELKEDYHVNQTFGGHFSLLAILDDLKPQMFGNSVVLLPSYLCPTLLQSFKQRQINYEFYKVDGDLFVDTAYLISKISDKVKAVLFIDYFGMSQKERLSGLINTLKEKGIKIIQDIAQCMKIDKSSLYGDYIFNSFRKFFPFEGSLLLSKTEINIDYTKNPNRKFLRNKRIGQLIRFFHLRWGLFSSSSFLHYFEKAEKHYYAREIIKMPNQNTRLINKINIVSAIEIQKKYYNRLLKQYSAFVPVLLNNEDFVPLGFIISIDNRDEIRSRFLDCEIFAPVHWNLPGEIDKAIFSESVALSNKMMTIPLTGMNEKKYSYLIFCLNKLIQR